MVNEVEFDGATHRKAALELEDRSESIPRIITVEPDCAPLHVIFNGWVRSIVSIWSSLVQTSMGGIVVATAKPLRLSPPCELIPTLLPGLNINVLLVPVGSFTPTISSGKGEL